MRERERERERERIVLHVGCGPQHILGTYGFNQNAWREIRLDIDPAAQPDLLASMTDLSALQDESVDAVFSSHNLEHLEFHQIRQTLKEIRRVLRSDGIFLITCPDLQTVCDLVVQDKLLDTAYTTVSGYPITAMDMLFGWRSALAAGQHAMAHRCGFTFDFLKKALSSTGFASIAISRVPQSFALYALAAKSQKKEAEMLALFRYHWSNTGEEHSDSSQNISPSGEKYARERERERERANNMPKFAKNIRK